MAEGRIKEQEMTNKNTMSVMVSIKVLSYKHVKYISQALESILNQNVNFKYEIVVGEDCSNDGSKEILLEYKKKYPEIFKLLLHEKNLGAAQNEYLVGKECKGKYIANLESDDYWCDMDKLQKQVDYLETHPDIVAVGSNDYFVDDDGKNPVLSLAPFETDKIYRMNDYLYHGMKIHTNTLMYRNIIPVQGDAYEKVRFCVPTMGDVFKRCLLYDEGNIYVFPEAMLCHRNGLKVSSSFQANQINAAMKNTYMMMTIVDHMNEYFDGKYDFTPKIATRLGALRLEALLGKIHLDIGEYKKVKEKLSKKNRQLIRKYILESLILKIRRKLSRRGIKNEQCSE